MLNTGFSVLGRAEVIVTLGKVSARGSLGEFREGPARARSIVLVAFVLAPLKGI